MEYIQLKEEVKKLGFKMVRLDDADYFEAVLLKSGLEQLTKKLDSLFGPPKWPSEKQLSAEVSEIIQDFGGIREDQTLYFLNEKNLSIFAMLWPWSDGERITLKLGMKLIG